MQMQIACACRIQHIRQPHPRPRPVHSPLRLPIVSTLNMRRSIAIIATAAVYAAAPAAAATTGFCDGKVGGAYAVPGDSACSADYYMCAWDGATDAVARVRWQRMTSRARHTTHQPHGATASHTTRPCPHPCTRAATVAVADARSCMEWLPQWCRPSGGPAGARLIRLLSPVSCPRASSVVSAVMPHRHQVAVLRRLELLLRLRGRGPSMCAVPTGGPVRRPSRRELLQPGPAGLH